MGSPAYKNSYNYSDDFQIGNRFCRVYCSDEVYYHVADKIKETSGRVFYYDMENSVKTNKNLRYLFSNILEERRTCVSEIYYKNNKISDSVDWRSIYGLGKNIYGGSDGISDEEIDGIDSWKTLFNALVKKAKTEGGRTENVNKILYDLYNCNLYSEQEIAEAGVIKPKKYKAKNIREAIVERFSKDNNYGIGNSSNCVIDLSNNTNQCITMNNITYDFGAPPDGKSASMSSTVEITNSFNDLIYCSGASCFAYDSDHKEQEYDYPTSRTSSTTELDVSDVFGSSASVFEKDKLNIPTNDYVMFDVRAYVSFYNNSRYEVKPSGDVINAGTERGKDYLKLRSFVYPVNRLAYTSSTCSDRSFLSTEGYRRCSISQRYDKIETFFRKNPDDEFYNTINLNKKYGCYVDVEIPTTECDPTRQICRIGTTYRNVDISNMFPSSTDGYTTKENSNWGTVNGKKATDDIEKTANEIRATNDYLQYRITLSPVQIANIKEYNKDNSTGYINEEKYDCQIVDDTYQNCTSPFMEELRNGDDYGSIDSKFNGIN